MARSLSTLAWVTMPLAERFSVRASVVLASDCAAYLTGQVLHPNGGEIING